MKIKAIAGFLGLLFLVGAAGVGVLALQRVQTLIPHASSNSNCEGNDGKSKCKAGKEYCDNGVCKNVNGGKNDNTSDAKTGTCVCENAHGTNCGTGSCTNNGGCNCDKGCTPKKNLCINRSVGSGGGGLPSCESFWENWTACIPAKYNLLKLTGGRKCVASDGSVGICCSKGFKPALTSEEGTFKCIAK